MANRAAWLVPFLLLMTIPALSRPDAAVRAYKVLSGRKLGPPTSSSNTENTYVVVFDAGSTGSRVHVYSFDENLDLDRIGDGLEVYMKVTPGLSAYAGNPQAAADSLVPLLEKAESVVPADLQSKTPVRVGATAGLRLIGQNASEEILQAVRELLKDRSTLKYEENAVSVLDGTQEGSYMWVTVNYLLGNLGKGYWKTTGTIDLGGGSVQMAYAISEADAANSPAVVEGDTPYVTEMYLKGRKYYIYVHSYLGYGLLAGRTQIFKVSGNDSANPCLLAGFDDYFEYNGVTYKAKALPSGASFRKCRRAAIGALNTNATCKYKECTFGGVWSGGGGAGQRNLFAASSFYYQATEAGVINPDSHTARARPLDYKKAAKIACATSFADAKSKYPLVPDEYLPYICMDLVYEYTLLVEGFGLRLSQTITVGKEIEYQNSLVEAAWPLGNAIEAVSSLTGNQIYIINLAKNQDKGTFV